MTEELINQIERIKLIGISKNERRSEYTFPKEQKIFGIIRSILRKLNFENQFNDLESFARPADEGGETIWEKEDKITGDKYNERILDFYNDKYYVHTIFFSKKVVLLFHYNEDKQQEIAKVIEKFVIEED